MSGTHEPAEGAGPTPPLLEISDLRVSYEVGSRSVKAVRGVDLLVRSGEALGIAGESGSGKSTLVMSFLRLLPATATVTGRVSYHGEDILTMNWGRVRAVRWAGASMIFQGAMSALNPVRTIATQISEPILLHEKVSPRTARARAAGLLSDVGLPATRLDAYPHELSGGQRQRAMIAMALACDPDLIIADEPTTALDVMVQAQILQLLKDLTANRSVGLVMISHDLSVLAEVCDRLAVMYAGSICEIGPTGEVRTDPRHPYSAALLDAFPVIGDPASRRQPRGLPGDPPDATATAPGCPFAPRCAVVMPSCADHEIELWPAGPQRQSSCLRVLPEFAADRPNVNQRPDGAMASVTERNPGR
ncbi:ABC transporter ATP-binding protein [Nakamurella lactea]|uniref:ABC transporter ATP-binding protein n=1 Tax=Nakamurella lactea TaxID=459515 RepID=UPI0004042DF6|nr:ABC transporter ATP-binding protein [Nakamurella lactea]